MTGVNQKTLAVLILCCKFRESLNIYFTPGNSINVTLKYNNHVESPSSRRRAW